MILLSLFLLAAPPAPQPAPAAPPASAAPTEPAGVLKIRAAYNDVIQKMEAAEDGGGITASVIPANQSGEPVHKVTFVSPDVLSIESKDTRLLFVRVEETWSNLGTSTSEYLFDAQGNLIFTYTNIEMGTQEPARALRMWIDNGRLLRVQRDAKVEAYPSVYGKSLVIAKGEAKRLKGLYKLMRATRVSMP